MEIVFALFVAALVLVALGGLGWLYGLSVERFSRPLRASAVEAGERTADLVADFRDWLRLGR